MAMAMSRPGGRTLAVLTLGALAVLAAIAVDPVALALLLDVEFLIAIGTAGVLMLRTDVRVAAYRLATSSPGVMVRAGVSVTRDRPHSLVG
jgi:hypothetical protein